MPLRDHFRAPLDDLASWEGFHGQWPAMLVLSLSRKLPPEYVAAPRVQFERLGDVSGSTNERPDVPTSDEYEVRVYDSRRGRRLVAAIEIVSPGNKGRLNHRRAFVAKCATLLQNQVSVVIIDLVTTRDFNLHHELLQLIGKPESKSAASPIYVVSCRATRKDRTWLLEAWEHPLTLGEALPTLPLWLTSDLAIPLELEQSYGETCRVLRLP
jgi:hypothetical protein